MISQPDLTASIGDEDIEADVDLDDTEDSARATEMSSMPLQLSINLQLRNWRN